MVLKMPTRTDLPAPYVERLAELVRMTRNGYGGEPWNLPGIKAAISRVQDTGAAPLDICCVALTSAADSSMLTPALMAQSGRHWTHVQTGRPEPRKCEHGKPVDTHTPGATTSSVCDPCQHPPGFVTAKEAGLKDQMRAVRETERDKRRAEQAQQQARRDAAHQQAKTKKRGRLEAARQELHEENR